VCHGCDLTEESHAAIETMMSFLRAEDKQASSRAANNKVLSPVFIQEKASLGDMSEKRPTAFSLENKPLFSSPSRTISASHLIEIESNKEN
jgi:hypothetical protein